MAAVEAAIREYQDPYLKTDLMALPVVLKSLIVDAGKALNCIVILPYPAETLSRQALAQLLTSKIENIAGVESVDVQVSWQVASAPVQGDPGNHERR